MCEHPGTSTNVANHLFGKLATSSCYIVDKSCAEKKDDNCFCDDKSCKMTGQYGDTSIGRNIFITGIKIF